MTQNKSISYFEGLNSLRFIAAFMVVMHHTETIRDKNNLPNLNDLGLFKNGGNAVTFFFVLSGFLITYLLLKENFKTNTICIKTFYTKRLLRIWPLYFLLVFIGTIILPQVFSLLKINYEMPYTLNDVWYYFVFFVPGLVKFYYGNHFLEPLWSIGVEEVFYLVWAPLFYIFRKKNIFHLLWSVIFIKLTITALGEFWIKNDLMSYILSTFKFEAMAVGGLGAYFVFHQKQNIAGHTFFQKKVQIIVYSLLILYLTFYTNFDNMVWNLFFKTPILSQMFLNSLFLYLIIDVSLVNQKLNFLKTKTLNFLGEISYGIYMYHMLIIFAIIQFLKPWLQNQNLIIGSLVFYSILAILVIAISAISKLTFENFFLNLRTKK